jgi:DNA repair exonuclease SbcCD ATPase subunit
MTDIGKISFDYRGIDKPEEVNQAEALAIQIEFYAAQTAMNAYETGKRLVLAKEIIGHGKWDAWLKAKFGWEATTARKLIKIAENLNGLSKTGNLPVLASNFQISALYLLAADSTPEEVRDEAIARAESGEKITHAEAKRMIEQAKAEARAEEIKFATEERAKAAAQNVATINVLEENIRKAKEEAEAIRRNNQELSQVANSRDRRLAEASVRLKEAEEELAAIEQSYEMKVAALKKESIAEVHNIQERMADLELEKFKLKEELDELKAKPAKVEVREVVKETKIEVESETARMQRLEAEAELVEVRDKLREITERVAKTEQENEDKDRDLKKANRRANELQKRLQFFEEEAKISTAVNLLIDAQANLTKSLEVLDISRSGRVIPACYQGVIENIIKLASSFRTPTGELVDLPGDKKVIDIANRG